MPDDYVAPRFQLDAFHCPFCSTLAEQRWSPVYRQEEGGDPAEVADAHLSTCSHCGETALWWAGELVAPPAPPPAQEVPSYVITDLLKTSVRDEPSPRAALALLRLALQRLLPHLDKHSGRLPQDVERLLRVGLVPMVETTLEHVRGTAGADRDRLLAEIEAARRSYEDVELELGRALRDPGVPQADFAGTCAQAAKLLKEIKAMRDRLAAIEE